MYNRYLDDMDNGGFVLLEPESQGPSQNHQGQQSHGSNPNYPNQNQNQHRPNAPHSGGPDRPMRSKNDLLKDVTGGLSQLLGGVLKHFSLENFDTGTFCWCSLSCSSTWRTGIIWSWSSPWACCSCWGWTTEKRKGRPYSSCVRSSLPSGRAKTPPVSSRGLTTSRALMAYTTSPPFSVSAATRRPLFTDTQ